MNIKTISQLPAVDGSINNKSLFGISQYSHDGDKFLSRKVEYQMLRDQLSAYVDNDVLNGLYKAKNSNGRINLSTLRSDVNTLQSGTTTIKGVKTFERTPIIASQVDVDQPKSAANVECVSKLISDQAGFMSEGQHLAMDPGNGTVGYTLYDGNSEAPNQMYWRIDHGQHDSSQWKDEYGAEAGPVRCMYTGNLVCYGWLADNGNVKPGQAWVGLFGRVTCGNNAEPVWAALQIQPWIMGKYSSTAQYVSFNIPVKAGLQLKIVTGFAVNGNNSGLHGDTPTLMFANEGNMPNAFVGYILRQ